MSKDTWGPEAWVPVRKGDVYCSPACGGQCKYKAYQWAKRQSAKLVKQAGPGWTARVWENLGWHYAISSPTRHVKVHPSCGGGDFLAFLGPASCSGGDFTAYGKTVQEAVRNVVAKARESVGDLEQILASVEGEACKPQPPNRRKTSSVTKKR